MYTLINKFGITRNKFIFTKLQLYPPEHSPLLHFSVFVEWPIQRFPPFAAICTTWRVDVLIPSPQVVEQEVHLPNKDQVQSTGTRK